VTRASAPGFPEAQVRERARKGIAAVFPPLETYGEQLHGAEPSPTPGGIVDDLDRALVAPPVFMPRRLEKLIDLGREPLHDDVDLATVVGGFHSPLPVYVSAFGSTRAAQGDAGIAASRQAGRLGIPMVIGENMVPVTGYRRSGQDRSPILDRLRAYARECPPGLGGVVVQQSTEDADSEVWNLVYSDPSVADLLDSGRLGFELKTGQGAKPGLGGMTMVDPAEAARLATRFAVREVPGTGGWLRCATPGTFTEEILRQQVRFMRNNFPRARVWVKFHPGRDVALAAATAWRAGSDAVTVDGAQGGTGWAPRAFLGRAGLPLGECLRRIGTPQGCLLASGRIWEGGRTVRALAMGATAVGLGRSALLAVDEDPEHGLIRLVEALALEVRMLTSAVGKYHSGLLDREDLWWPAPTAQPHPGTEPIVPALERTP
jgi:hypothetical protein